MAALTLRISESQPPSVQTFCFFHSDGDQLADQAPESGPKAREKNFDLQNEEIGGTVTSIVTGSQRSNSKH